MLASAWRRGARRRRSSTQTAPQEERDRIDRRQALRAFPWSKLLALLLLGGSLWLFLSLLVDARFQVEEVQVEGAKLLSPAEVQQVVDGVGRSLLTLRTTEIEARLLKEYGCLRSATIRARLPNQVTVLLQEREALWIWESGGRYWWVGHGGKVLGQAKDPGELPIVHDVNGVALEPQGRLVGVPWPLIEGMLLALPAAKSYAYTPEQGLVLQVTAAGWPLYLGHGGDAAQKVAIAQALVDRLLAQKVNVAYIDLRNERRPTYKMR